MEKLFARYEGLPEWSRWVICWPLSFAGAVLLGLLFLLFGSLHLPAWAIRLAQAVFVQIAFLMMIYAMVPRGKFWFALSFAILRSFFLIFFTAITALVWLGVVPSTDEIGEPLLTWRDWWSPFLGEAITAIASIWLLSILWDDRREKRVQAMIEVARSSDR